MVEHRMRLSRADRQELILHELRNSSSTWVTVTIIARMAKMEPSTHLRNMLNELVDQGRLHMHINWGSWDGGSYGQVMSRWYCLPERDPRKEMFG